MPIWTYYVHGIGAPNHLFSKIYFDGVIRCKTYRQANGIILGGIILEDIDAVLLVLEVGQWKARCFSGQVIEIPALVGVTDI